MPLQGKRDLAKERYWRKALARFATSGKTRAEFCAAEALATHAFDYWQRVILERDAEPQGNDPSHETESTTFVPIVVAEHAARSNVRQLAAAEIVFAGGSVFLFSGIDSATLVALFRALRESVD